LYKKFYKDVEVFYTGYSNFIALYIAAIKSLIHLSLIFFLTES